jgi:hypothetical protein
MATPLILSNVKPDFESLLLQLQIYLQSTDAWKDLQTSGTGETLMEMMAAVGALNQFGIESAAREGNLVNAVRDSSIYAITRMLGVRIHRKTPAGVQTAMTRTDTSLSVAIPAYTQFTVNGTNFFNRNALMFAQGSTVAAERLFYGPMKTFVNATQFTLDISAINVSVLTAGDTFTLVENIGGDKGTVKRVVYVGGNVGEDLFQLAPGETPFTDLSSGVRISLMSNYTMLYAGTVTAESFVSDGSAFRQIFLTPTGFKVSDLDINVTVTDPDGVVSTWAQIQDGIWNAGVTDQVYQDSTSGLGQAIITFGDGANGAIPVLGNTITVKYVTTNGSTDNNGLSSLDIKCTDYAWITGKTTTVISGGADEKPSSYYKYMAPYIFKRRNRAVLLSDYQGVCVDYPGIVSASIMAQKDIAPHDLRWMNQVQLTLLPADTNLKTLTDAEWNDFLTYLTTKRHAAIRPVKKDATSQSALIELTLALKNQYLASDVLPVAEASIYALFARRSDTLGRRITISDVIKAATVSGVDYVDLSKCKLLTDSTDVTDLVPMDKTCFIELSSLLVNTMYSERTIYSDGSS